MLLLLTLLFKELLFHGASTVEKPEAWVSKSHSSEPGHVLLVCHVSGFHPKPVWVMWMQDGYSILLILICLTVIVSGVMLVVVGSWSKKQSSNQNICSPYVPSSAFSTEVNTQDPRNSGNHLFLVKKLWLKSRILKKWKTSLRQL
uniref:CD1e molecule n=1 Tax=Rousettus aegyptiacus TaxID=9407 RepID=A0A7J8BCA1_ROUAE|nr:CD1e molecule [Rousettus aegyptiacus]